MPLQGTARERAVRGKALCKAGYLGEKAGPPSRAPEDVQLLFESMANSFDTAAIREPGVIQWDFTDYEPWHLVVQDGQAHPARGRAEGARLRLRVSFEDWVDVVADRHDPRQLALRGRLRPRGDLRWAFRKRRPARGRGRRGRPGGGRRRGAGRPR